MPIEMPKGLPFVVDTWSPSSRKKSESLFVGIEVAQSVVIDDVDGAFTVTAFDANHCPGALMFLFEGNFGNILHTGDCRLTPECLQNLPEKYLSRKGKEPKCPLDFVFLDCTFGRSSQKFPSKHLAIHQVINCIWKHPDAPVIYLSCDLLGQEDILRQVSQTFGTKIYVDRSKSPDCYQALALTSPEIISQDSSSRFQIFDGFPRLYERAKLKLDEARKKFQDEPLIIRPSAQWYVCDEEFSEGVSTRNQRINEAVKDQSGVWHVCYSIHSSKEELEWALHSLAPQWVVSTSPSCRAMELNYIKKHCALTKITSNHPIWKLLDFSIESSLNEDASVEVQCSLVEGPSETYLETQLLQIEEKISAKPKLCLSPLSKKLPVTLFGKARLGLRDLNFYEEPKMVSKNTDPPQAVDENKVEQLCQEEKRESIEENSLESRIEGGVFQVVQSEKLAEGAKEVHRNASCLTVGSSNAGFSEKFRKLYRVMNVPVPEPLPSLVELLKSGKSVKRRFEF